MIRVGVIGTGAMGQNHVRIYSEMEDVDLIGICDLNEAQVTKLAKRYHTDAYSNHKELLSIGLDAVSIAVPTIYHKQVAIDAINYGTNILIEKPIADTTYNGNIMVKAADNANLKLMVGHVERFNPAVQMAKKLINKGYIGEILSIHTTRIGPRPQRINDVGVILDLAIHDIDLIRYLSGQNFVKINCEKHLMKNGLDDEAMILLWAGNILSSVNVSWRSPKKVRTMKIIGEKGVITLDYINQDLELFRDPHYTSDISSFANLLLDYSTGTIEKPIINKSEPLRVELSHFIDFVKNGAEPLITGHDALQTLAVVEELMKMEGKHG